MSINCRELAAYTTNQLSKRYFKIKDELGTLNNKKISLRVSTVAATPMLGIFANQDIAQGEAITGYGGIRRAQTDFTQHEPSAHNTHARNLPSSGGNCLDGKPLADLLKYNQNGACEVEGITLINDDDNNEKNQKQ
eukprot:UN01757